MRTIIAGLVCCLAWSSELTSARDRQDIAALEKHAAALKESASRSADDAYRFALVKSYIAEVAAELRDKQRSASAAEQGIQAARQAVTLAPNNAEFRRILGTLCGQIIPANILAGLKYGRCALDEINKAIELNPKSAMAYVSRGVGNYYLPPSFGGGVEPALKDLHKAIELDPKLPDAHLWLGVVLRKANKNAEARAAFQRALQLNPQRLWAKQQLEKTPAQ